MTMRAFTALSSMANLHAKEKPTIDTPVAFDCSGSLMAQAKDGEHISLVRFDGDNGEYSLLLGNAKTVDGPYTKGTYMWVEVCKNLDRLEDKLVQGPTSTTA